MEALNGVGGGSGIPASIMRAHTEELRAAGSLAALARIRRAARSSVRLSRARVMAVTESARAVYAAGGVPGGDHALAPISEKRFLKDIDLLADIGDNGVKITVDPDFVPVPERGDIPLLYKENMDAVNGHTYTNLNAGHTMLLSASAVAEEDINQMNLGSRLCTARRRAALPRTARACQVGELSEVAAPVSYLSTHLWWR